MYLKNKEINRISFYNKINIEVIKGESLHSFPKHSHSGFCIGIVTNGNAKLDLKDRQYILGKYSMYFIPPFIEHTIAAVDKMIYSYTVIYIKNKFIERYSNGLLNKYVCEDEKVVMNFLELCDKAHGTNDYEKFEKEVEQFLEQNIEMIPNSQKQTNNEVVLLAVDFIKEHLAEQFNLERVSEYTHMSKYYLLRLFKKQMGVAPYQFYMQEKVKKIRQGIIKDKSTVDLAYHLNFSDQSHLCNIFKRYVGLTPAQFKKSYIANKD
jgi:AraC-like DNA-binding protein